MALRGEPLFPEQLEAWVHGPVCREVYAEYKNFGHKPIDVDVELTTFPPELVEHISDVWEAYGQFSAFDLERLSHRELPWKEARGALPMDVGSSTPLDLAVMKQFFTAEAKSRG